MHNGSTAPHHLDIHILWNIDIDIYIIFNPTYVTRLFLIILSRLA